MPLILLNAENVPLLKKENSTVFQKVRSLARGF